MYMNANLQISQRGIDMPVSPIRKLAPLAYEAEDQGVKIYRLNIGQPDLPTPQKALDALKNISRTTLEYSPSQGYRSLRQALVNYYERYQIKLTADEIIITSGGSEAVLFAFMSCLNPGDEIIVSEPAYANYMSLAISAGAVIRTVATTIDEGFCLPKVEKFEELINERTKAILICNPNNPTGSLIPEKKLLEIIEIAKSVNAYILSDEVYRGLNQTDEYTPSVADLYEKGISVCSMSKVFSLAGLRLGWIASKNKDVIESCIHHREYNMISCSIIDECIAALALQNADKIIKRNQKIIRECLSILDDWVQTQKHFSYIKPQAGTTALIYYDFDMTSKELCDKLAKEKGVFLTPGFCFETEHCFRVGYCKNPEELKNGLQKISEFIQESNLE